MPTMREIILQQSKRRVKQRLREWEASRGLEAWNVLLRMDELITCLDKEDYLGERTLEQLRQAITILEDVVYEMEEDDGRI